MYFILKSNTITRIYIYRGMEERLENEAEGTSGRVEEFDGVKRLTAQTFWWLVMTCKIFELIIIRSWRSVKASTGRCASITGLVQCFNFCRSQLK